MSPLRRAAATWRVPLFRASYALMATTALNAALGLLFWVAAARLYPARAVGLGAGAVSALTLVSAVGWMGLQYMLIRYVPVAGRARGRLVAATYAVAVLVALVAALIFVAFFAGDVKLGFLAAGLLPAAGFLAAVALWVVFSLQDAVLIGLRRALLVPVENAAYGAMKLGLLVGLAAVATPFALFGSWVIPTALLVAVVNVLLFRRLFSSSGSGRAEMPERAKVVRFAAGHHAVTLIAVVPDSLVPLLVLGLVSEEANAFYYAAWTVSFSLRLLAVNMANALTVEGAHARQDLWRLLRTVSRLSALVLVPLTVFILVAAGPILDLFGRDYGREAGALLRLLGLSLVPFAVVTVALAVERVRERVAAALAIAVASTGTTIALDLWLLPSQGIQGAGLGWLGGQLLASLVAMVVVLRPLSPRPAARHAAGAD